VMDLIHRDCDQMLATCSAYATATRGATKRFPASILCIKQVSNTRIDHGICEADFKLIRLRVVTNREDDEGIFVM